ncbi:hypothetical protein AOC36_00690 [Erysipelothrix larvae]|uniref:ABC-2 type transporter transmembrane domain-containing protein n=1 Tax=Erysipelothrix larvae TaxID=1514105 RepID=A0A0X8GY37_9FIRM|nr:ABC transporter permease [Erysipelothrix larvae]AMC92561.1 hypothetical protein AOC36_00690 [Erysipelothrix larvae]
MKRLITYEIKNILTNIFAIIFGVFFPIFMTLLFYLIYKEEIPASALSGFTLKLFVTNMLIIPLALVFIGFAALFSQEIEKGVTQRLTLFGITTSKQLLAKMAAQALTLLTTIILYSVILVPILKIPMPSMVSFLTFVISLILFSVFSFIIAYSIATLTRKFSVTYGITMVTYFGIMILSGMMGIQPENLPQGLRYASNLLPTTHVASVIPEIWNNSTSNFAPMIQSFIFMGALSAILYFITLNKNKRTLSK